MSSKSKAVLSLVGVVVVIGTFVVYNKFFKKDITTNLTVASVTDAHKIDIKISPQQVTNNEVTIDSVTLPKNGFAVVRMVEGERLSQVVEISKILEPGTHNNIKISWDPTLVDVGSNDLIVMIYEDSGDGIFNDDDIP